MDDVTATAPPIPPRNRAPEGSASRGLGRAGPVAVVATVWPIFGTVVTASAAPFVAPWLRAQGPAGVAYFVVAISVLGAIAFAPTYATSLVAGWTFGFRAGFPAILGGAVIGALACYAAARRVAGERVAATFHDHPKWEHVRRAFVESSRAKTLWLVALLRLSPVLPFGTTNVLLATTGVPLPTYVAGTILGLAPRTGLVTLAAASAGRLDPSLAESWPALVLGISATAACIVLFAVAGKRALDRATRAAAPADPEQT